MSLSATLQLQQGRGRSALAALVGIARVLAIGGLAVYSGLLLIAVAPVALGLRSTVVLTGSMRPAIQPGDVVLSSQVPVGLLRPGQVLLFDNPAHQGVYLMHRYARPGPNGSIITRGDANRVEDSTPVPGSNVRGVPRLRVPWVGMPIVWLRLGTPIGVKYAGAALAALLLLALVPRRRREPAATEPRSPRVHRVPRLRRIPRTASALALLVSFALATHLSTPGANASFFGDVGNPNTFQTVSSFYGSAILDDAPTGYWRLDGSGTTITNATGGAPGTYVGSVRPAAGATPDGDAAAALPSGGWFTVPHTAFDDLTVEFWFAATTGYGAGTSWDANAPLVGTAAVGRDGDFGVTLDATGRVVAGTGNAVAGTDPTIVSAGSGYNDGAWHHVAFTRVRSTGAMSLYVDGALAAAGTGGTEALDARTLLYFGVTTDKAPSSNDRKYGGDYFDEVATYAAALPAGAIAAHFAARTAGYAAAAAADSPAGYWPLDEAAGTALAASFGAAGTYTGEITYGGTSAANAGTSVKLHATGGYALIPRVVADDFSLEFWFAGTGGANTGHWWNVAGLIDADQSGGPPANDFGVGLDENGRVLAGIGNPDTTIASASGGYNDGGWHQVVLTRTKSSGAIVLYVDGASVASHAGTGNTNSLDAVAQLTVGRSIHGVAADASFDEIAQYTTVLTPAQVLAHYLRATS